MIIWIIIGIIDIIDDYRDDQDYRMNTCTFFYHTMHGISEVHISCTCHESGRRTPTCVVVPFLSAASRSTCSSCPAGTFGFMGLCQDSVTGARGNIRYLKGGKRRLILRTKTLPFLVVIGSLSF